MPASRRRIKVSLRCKPCRRRRVHQAAAIPLNVAQDLVAIRFPIASVPRGILANQPDRP
jgi:hypothetical protein